MAPPTLSLPPPRIQLRPQMLHPKEVCLPSIGAVGAPTSSIVVLQPAIY